MIIEYKVVGAPRLEDQVVELASDVTTTLRQLLERLVEEELAGYRERQAAGALLRVLSPADLEQGLHTGRYRAEPRDAVPGPPLADAVARACEAFEDQSVYVFVDDVQVLELDTPLILSRESRIRLVRLVALAGG